MISALLSACANYSVIWLTASYEGILIARFLVGFFLAGIYPVGMKIAVSWYPKGLGLALGFLVGALVLGTAFPHLVRALGQDWPWQVVIQTTSIASVLGGLFIWLLLGDGPNRPVSGELHPKALIDAFRSPDFRLASALGLFWPHVGAIYVLGFRTGVASRVSAMASGGFARNLLLELSDHRCRRNWLRRRRTVNTPCRTCTCCGNPAHYLRSLLPAFTVDLSATVRSVSDSAADMGYYRCG